MLSVLKESELEAKIMDQNDYRNPNNQQRQANPEGNNKHRYDPEGQRRYFGYPTFGEIFPALNSLSDLFDTGSVNPEEAKQRQGHGNGLMKTDILDDGNDYVLTIEIPGLRKENVKVLLKDGYLTVKAYANAQTNGQPVNGQPHKGNYLVKERFTGSCQRSFYVGEKVRLSDIKAHVADGLLTVSFPKNAITQAEAENEVAID